MIRVLIVGLGSIGQRHANALLQLGVTNIAALRSMKGTLPLSPALENKLAVFCNEDEAFNWNPTHLIISNPTSLHLHFIRRAIKNDIKFFVEKPIDHSYVNVFEETKSFNKVNGSVGYVLRFHGIYQFLKKIIDSEYYGRVLASHLHVGQYLPNWHAYEDYRNAYYAKKSLGGGAIRTLSHEIDMVQFLFGTFLTVYSRIERVSNLEIDVDDFTTIIAKTEKCNVVTININFLDPTIVRKGIIYFDKGVIEYDWIAGKIYFLDNQATGKLLVYTTQEEYNLQFFIQMQHFIQEEDSGVACSFRSGLEVLRIIEACEKSNVERKEICLA